VKTSTYVIASLFTVMLAGCYTLEPASTVAPSNSSKVAFDVTDAGRVALGGSMGPEIDQIEGFLRKADSSSYTVGVTTVRFLRGGEQKWSGEPVVLRREYVARSYVRTLDRGRSIALAAVGVGAIAFIVTRSLIPEGNPVVEVPVDTNGASRRGVLPAGLGRRKPGRSISPLWFPPHLSRP
jgi:hypothetical protein